MILVLTELTTDPDNQIEEIKKVLQIEEKEVTDDSIKLEYKKMIDDKLSEVINRLDRKPDPSSRTWNILRGKISRENPITDFIISNYKAKELQFEQVYI